MPTVRTPIGPAVDAIQRIKARLAAELAKAKTDRESGKKIGRDRPARSEDQRGGGKNKAGR